MDDQNSMDPFNDLHNNDPMEFNFQDIMNDRNPTLADLDAAMRGQVPQPEPQPAPQPEAQPAPAQQIPEPALAPFPESMPAAAAVFGNTPSPPLDEFNSEDLIGGSDEIITNEEYFGEYDYAFNELVRVMREAEIELEAEGIGRGPMTGQQLIGNQHGFEGFNMFNNNQNVVGVPGSGGLSQPLQNQLQGLNASGGGGGAGGGAGGGNLLRPLSPSQFPNLNIQGGGGAGAGRGLLPPLQPNQFPNMNTQGGGGGGGFMPQLQPFPYQMQQPNQIPQNFGGGQSQPNQVPQNLGGGQSQPNQNRAHPVPNAPAVRMGSGSGSNQNTQADEHLMPSQRAQAQMNRSLLQESRNRRRNPLLLNCSNVDEEWDLEQCRACQVIRDINHTDGRRIGRLEVHGGLLHVQHIVTVLEEDGVRPDVKRFVFTYMGLKTVKTFIQRYCELFRESGYVMLEDRFSEFYDTLSVELYRRPSSEIPDENNQPISLSGSGDRRRGNGSAGSSSGPRGGNGRRRGGRTNLSRQRERTGKLTLADLSIYFHLPMEEAASRINLCLTVVKKICRRFGMVRWPHRKIQSLDKRILHYQQRMDTFDADQRQRARDIIKRCQEDLALIYRRGITEDDVVST